MNTKLINVFYNKAHEKLKVGRLAIENRKIYFEYDYVEGEELQSASQEGYLYLAYLFFAGLMVK